MSKSTGFTPSSDAQDTTVFNQVTLTDVTGANKGAFQEVTEVKNLTQGITTYYDSASNVVVPTVDQEVAERAISVVLGQVQINDVTTATDLATAGVTVPANSLFMYVEPKGTNAIYTIDGTAPNGTVDPSIGKRINDGGRICIYGADAIANFQIASLDGVTPLDVDVEFKNVSTNDQNA